MKLQEMKKLLLFLLKLFPNNGNEMKLLIKEPITKLEKWLNRIVTIAIALYEFIKNLPPNWLNNN